MALHPTIFISHGPPSIAVRECAAAEFLRELGKQLPRPAAVICVSAHWEAAWPLVSGTATPTTIHDFGGPPALFRLCFPCPGAPELAERIEGMLTAAGVKAAVDPDRGLDHGAWVPLSLMYPAADIPVVQLSVQTALDPAHHFELGRILSPLRREGVLIMGSGGATHNLPEVSEYTVDAPPVDYAERFDDWLRKAILEGRTDAILDYKTLGPDAEKNHPYPAEHFLPLFVPFGAAGKAVPGRDLHRGFMYGVLSMAAYIWEGGD